MHQQSGLYALLHQRQNADAVRDVLNGGIIADVELLYCECRECYCQV